MMNKKTHWKWADFKLLAMDMDSTLINIECVDEIGAAVGKKAEVAAITEAAMRGEIADYAESLRLRVALLKGVPLSALEDIYANRLKLNPGCEVMLAVAKAQGLKTLVVSGGFTFFTERLKTRLSLDFTRSNELEIVDGKLTGKLVGEIVDGEEKRATVERICASLGVSAKQAIAVGDGSNDLPMMRVTGLSIAYHAKPKVQLEAMIAINEGGLDAWLEQMQ
jgi:phosphoserine phosphatase